MAQIGKSCYEIRYPTAQHNWLKERGMPLTGGQYFSIFVIIMSFMPKPEPEPLGSGWRG